MRLKILSLLLLSLFILAHPAYAERAGKLPGKIVFRSDREGGAWGIYVLANGRLKKVYGEWGAGPKWSPDGMKILIPRNDPEFIGLAVTDKDGKNETRYPTRSGLFQVEWLPDLKAVVFGSSRTREQTIRGEKFTDNLFRYDLERKKETQLTFFEDGKNINGLAVSPDGKRMLFNRYDFDVPNSTQYYIANTDGSDLQELKNISPLDPHWSSDSKTIVYTSGDFKGEKLGYGVISIYDFETGEERIVLEAKEKGTVVSQPVFSPDGTQILFSRWSGLYVIHIDGTGLRTVVPSKRGDALDSASSDVEPDWTA